MTKGDPSSFERAGAVAGNPVVLDTGADCSKGSRLQKVYLVYLQIPGAMAHLNIYLPDEFADKLKREANAAKVPLSRYLLSLLSDRGEGGGWPAGYLDHVCGFLAEPMAEPADALPEPVEAFELPE